MPQAEQAASAKSANEVDWSDVQGEIFQPYMLDHEAHLLVQFPTAAAGKKFLGAIKERVSRADEWDKSVDQRCNLGLTYTGFAALGLSADELESFPYPFRVGMAQRAAILGDVQASAPEQWEKPYGQRDVHGWVMVKGKTAVLRDTLAEEIADLAKHCGVAIMLRDDADDFTGPGNRTKEHFGFTDGIGQPAVCGAPGPSYPGQGTPQPDGTWKDIALGSFLLGYPDEMGYNAPFPANPTLRRNGTFMAYRKLAQHVGRFRDYIEANKHLVGGNGDLLAAKMVGRWRSGAPLELCPNHDDPAIGDDDQRTDNFRYNMDVEGMRVPHLSHIRRANPRDGLPEDSVIQPRLHRIIRRKTPYGPYLPEGAAEDDVARGIIFRVYNARIASQFEMVQSEWFASGNDAGGLSTDQDPITGLTDPDDKGPNRLGATMAIPREDGIKTLYGLPRFVTLKGGEYFFLPSLSAIDWLVGLGDPAGGAA